MSDYDSRRSSRAARLSPTRRSRSVSAGLWLVCTALALLTAHAVAAPPLDLPEGGRARVLVQVDRSGLDTLSARGLDVGGHDLDEGRVEVVVDREELAWLAEQGFALTLVEFREHPQPLAQGSAGGEPSDGPLPDTRYTDPAEMESFLQQVAADHPQITHLVSIGSSHQGRTIWAMKVSDNADVEEDELAILFSGAHHAREVMTPEVIIDTIEVLTDGYEAGDPDTVRRVDEYEIWCVPIVNPDGVATVHEFDDFWRKNNRDNNGNGDFRDSEDGVDLNRNYEWGWGNQCGGSSSSHSFSTYRGPFEGSEPETQAMVRLGRRIRPVFDIEYHTYGEDVFYALSCDPVFSPALSTVTGSDQSISRVIAEDYAGRIIQADGGVGFSAAPYGSRVDGVGRDQQYHENGAIGFVTEMNNSGEGGFHPDYGTYRDVTVEGQRPAWQWLIDRIGGPAIGGRVSDSQSGLPVVADVSLAEMSLPDGKRLYAHPDTGRFHLIVVPGDYTLRVRAPGYAEVEILVTVGSAWLPTDVALDPLGATLLVDETFEESPSSTGWSPGAAGDTATDGQWEWAEPHGTHNGIITTVLEWGAPRIDYTAGEGKYAFVTGAAANKSFIGDDVDGGVTTLVSPGYDLSGFYGVELTWHRWFRKEAGEMLDRFEAEVSVDGGLSWLLLEELATSTSTGDATPAWTQAVVRLDDVVPPGADTKLRFRVVDETPDHIVEGAIDDLSIRGFSLASEGLVTGVVVTDGTSTVVSWEAIRGGEGAVYDVVRGEVASLTGSVDLGPLTCIEENSSDTDTGGSPDTDSPPAGTARFYLVRFELGFSLGGYGFGSAGGERSGSSGCLP